MKKIDISIIIPTYKREAILCKTIESIIQEILYAEHHGIFCELIIVDQTKQHSEQSTNEFLKKVSEKDFITYIFCDVPNLPNARNVGINYAQGTYILFLDDDVLLDKKFITNCFNTYVNQQCDAVVGRITLCNDYDNNILLEDTKGLKRIVRFILFYLLGKNKAGVITKYGIILGNYTILHSGFTDCGRGCCMSFKRSIFDNIGKFDTNYIGNAIREETDFFFRMKQMKLSIYYNKDIHLYHLMANTGGTRTDKNKEYWKTYFFNQTYFYLKNFRFSVYTIAFILIFDVIKCYKRKINAIQLVKEGVKRAKRILHSIN